MDTDSSGHTRRLAHPIHTVLFLALLGAFAYISTVRASNITANGDPHRVAMYLRIIGGQWLLLALAIAGVWYEGTPVRDLFSRRWDSLSDLLRDLAIGAAFWLGMMIVIGIVGALIETVATRNNSGIQHLLPASALESMLWIVVSISAGICEETIYRSYLQRQLAALFNSVACGIVISALAFAGSHAYQGWRRASAIFVGAILSGVLAYRLKNIRPLMIQHTMQDSIAPILIRISHSR